MRCAGGKGVQMDAMRVLESNNSSSSSDNNNDQGTKTKPPATRTASLKTRLALLVFAETPLTTHHSLPSPPPQKAGPTACAGMCVLHCSRPAGGEERLQRSGWPSPPSFAWPSRKYAIVDPGNDRHPRHQRTDKGMREQISRAWVAAVSLLLLLLCRRMCCRRQEDCLVYNYGTVRAARPDTDVRRGRTPHTCVHVPAQDNGLTRLCAMLTCPRLDGAISPHADGHVNPSESQREGKGARWHS